MFYLMKGCFELMNDIYHMKVRPLTDNTHTSENSSTPLLLLERKLPQSF